MAKDDDEDDYRPRPRRICPACGASNPYSAVMCVECMAPLDPVATMDPMGSAITRADFMGKGLAQILQPKTTVAIVVAWTLFSMTIAVTLSWLVELARRELDRVEPDPGRLVCPACGTVFLVLPQIWLLARAHRCYFRARRKEQEEAAGDGASRRSREP